MGLKPRTEHMCELYGAGEGYIIITFCISFPTFRRKRGFWNGVERGGGHFGGRISLFIYGMRASCRCSNCVAAQVVVCGNGVISIAGNDVFGWRFYGIIQEYHLILSIWLTIFAFGW